MAEFCLDCWNRMNGTCDSEEEYIISKDLDLCEGCGQWKHVIVAKKEFYYHYYMLSFFWLLFKLVGKVIYFLWNLLLLPYWIFKNNRLRK
ncbi:MAG: hypothetical protein IJE46_06645 [Clostridia bacterium]|nr:hypothetical protein [Clostridia bacterium]